MSSTSFPSDKKVYESTGIIGLPDGGCPLGTVPIQRITNKAYLEKYLAGNEYVSN